jgi:CBS domain-containing protein
MIAPEIEGARPASPPAWRRRGVSTGGDRQPDGLCVSDGGSMDRLTAGDVMTTEVRAVRADTPLEEIAQLLATRHISGVPVVEEDGQVIGMVSEADLIDEDKRAARIPRTALFGFFPVPEDVLREAYRGGKHLTADDVMTKKVTTAAEDTPLSRLAGMMITRRINRVPILRDGKLVGIVSRADLVRALAARDVK